MAPKGKSLKRRRRDSDDEEDKDSDIDRAVTTSSKGKRHERHDLNILLAQDEAEASRQNINCWRSLRAGPACVPPRHFCCVCGFFASYKCTECAKHRPTPYTRYFCSTHCLSLHTEVDCCKPRNLTVW
eukprot:GHVQ01020351.1.p1 GENE.GHVQ01020351.1~~GHVQ01020351.1.p1  ORF type:complete len:128 (+),score=19.92 GHVQ01020351.1:155-538(+)